jgi:hypothetical protein
MTNRFGAAAWLDDMRNGVCEGPVAPHSPACSTWDLGKLASKGASAGRVKNEGNCESKGL